MKVYNFIYEYPCYIRHIIGVSYWNEVGTFGQFVDHYEDVRGNPTTKSMEMTSHLVAGIS